MRFEQQVLAAVQPDDGRYAAPVAAAAEARRLTASHFADIQHLLMGLDQPSRCARFGWAASNAALVAHARDAISK